MPTVEAIARAVRGAQTSAREVVAAALAEIEVRDGALNSFLHVDARGALGAAERIDAAVADGRDPGPLAGVPVAVKDSFCTRRMPTTCGSRLLEGYVPPYDAAAVARLEAAGAVIVGKTNMDEFSMGASGEWSAFGATRNPRDAARVPGGSSSGSAAAVAAGCVPIALGADTGGSVRQPASLCGVVGFKPSYGRVSRFGLVAFASSLDTPGVLGATVDCCARAFEAIAGPDPRDATSASATLVMGADGLRRAELSGLRIGVPRRVVETAAAPEARRAYFDAIAALESQGARPVEIALPAAERFLATYAVLAFAEASSNLARFDGMRFGRRVERETAAETVRSTRARGFGAEVKRRLLAGAFSLSAGHRDRWYERARSERVALAASLSRAFDSIDFIALPTSPTEAFRFGERIGDPLDMYASDLFTVPASLAGLPAVSIPFGCGGGDPGDLPLGFQIIGRAGADADLLRAAAAVEVLRNGSAG